MSPTVDESVIQHRSPIRTSGPLLQQILLICGIGYGVTYVVSNDLIAAAMFFRNDSATTTGTYELQLQTVDPSTGFPQGVTLGLARRSATGRSNAAATP